MKRLTALPLLTLLVTLLGTSSASALTRFSVATGNWNSTGTWSATSGGASGASVPVAGDTVTIERGFTVTVDINNAACTSLQLGGAATANAGTLTFAASGSPSLTVSGAVRVGNSGSLARDGFITFTSGSTLTAGSLTLGGTGTTPAQGTIAMTAGGTLSVDGAITVGAGSGTWTPGTGTVELTGTAALPATIFTSFNNLTINSATTTMGVGLTITGDLTIASGATLDASTGNFAISTAGNWINNGGTFTPRAGTVTFTGSSTAINGTATSQTFFNLTENKTAGQTLSVGGSTTSLTVNNLTETQGNFTAPATLDVNGGVTLTAGTFTAPDGSGTFTVAGNWSIANAAAANFTANGGKVTFNGTLAQSISSGTTPMPFNDLEIANTSVAVSGANNFNVAGTMTVDANATFSPVAAVVINNAAAAGTLVGSGTIQVTRTAATPDLVSQYKFSTYTLSSMTVNYSAAAAQTVNATSAVGSYGALQITGGGLITKTLGGAVTVNGNLTIAGSTTLDVSANNFALSVGGNWANTGTFTPRSGSVTLNGSGPQSIASGLTFSALVVNKSAGTATLGAAATVSSTLTIQSGTFDANGRTVAVTGLTTVSGGTYLASTATQTLTGGLTISGGIFTGSSGAVTVSGTVTLNSGTLNAPSGTFNVAGDWANNGGTFNPGSGTVTFTGAGAQAINGTTTSQSFNNITLNKGNTLNASGLTSLTVNSLTETAGNFTAPTTGTLEVDGSVTLTAGTFTAPNASGTFTVAGNWVNNGGAFASNGGTVTFNGVGPQTISGTAGLQTFNDLIVNDPGQTVTVGGSTTTLTLHSMTLTAGTFVAGTATTINVTGDWENDGGAFTPGAGTVNFNNTSAAQAIDGTAASQTFNSITVAKTAQTLSVGGSTTTLTLNGTMTLTSGTFAAGTATAINVAGNWAQATGAIFTPGSGTVTFNGSGAQTIGTAASLSFNDLTVNKSAGALTMATTTTLTVNNLTVTLGSFTPPATFNINGSATLTAGTLTAGANINIAGDWSNNGGTFTPGGNTVTFNSTSGPQAINGTAASQAFNNLIVNKTGQTLSVGGSTTTLTLSGTMTLTAGTFDAGTATTINVAVNWATATAATFTPGTGTVVFNGTGAQAINGTATSQTFYNVTLTKTAATLLSVGGSTTTLTVNNLTETTGNFTPPATLNVNGNLTLTAGTLTAGANIFIAGNYSAISGAIFTAGTGTVTFNGSSSQSLGGTVGTTFYNLTINNGTGVTLGASPTINRTLTLTSGVITTTGSYQVNVAYTSNAAISGASSSSYVNGTLQKSFAVANGQSFSFPIGDAANYTPVALSAMNVTVAGSLKANTTGADHPSISTSGIDASKSVNRYWTLTQSGGTLGTFTAAFNYLATDVDVGATASQFVVRQFTSPSTWSTTTLSGAPTTTLATITGETAFGDFAIGDQGADAAHSTVAPATASITANGTSTQVITVQARDTLNVNLPAGGATVLMSKAGGGTLSAVTDNNNGTYTATLTSPTTAGSAIITATLNGTAVGTAVGASSSVISYLLGVTSLNTANSTTLGTTLAVTMPAGGVPVGNTVILTFAMDPNTGTVSATDDEGNSYSVDNDNNVSTGVTTGVRTVVLSAHVTTALVSSDHVTITHPSVTSRAASACYVSGIVSASRVDQTAVGGSTTAATSGATGSATTRYKDEVLIGAVGIENSSTAFTVGASYTALSPVAANTGTAGTSIAILPEYRIVNATGAYTAGGSGWASSRWAADMVTYRTADVSTPISIGQISATGAGTSLAVAVPAAGVAKGNTIIVSFELPGTVGTVSVADSKGNTYSSDAEAARSNMRTLVFSAPVTTALVSGDTITVTSPSAANRAVSIYYVGGLASASRVDQTSSGNGSGANPSSGATATTSQPNELLWGAIGFANTGTFTVGGSFAMLTRANAGTAATIQPTYQIVSATGAYTASGSISSGAPWAAAIVTYKMLGGVEPSHSTIAPATASITADGTSTQVITVQAYDAYDNAITTGGEATSLSLASGTGTLGGTTDNGDGTYTATLTAPTAVGSGTVTATLNGVSVGTAVGASSSVVTYTPGPATQILVETAADGSGTVVPAQDVTAGTSIIVYAITRDVNNNFVANAAATWSLVSKTLGVADSDLAASGDFKNATFTGHLVGTAAIDAASDGLAKTDSGTITVIVGAPNAYRITDAASGAPAAGVADQLTITLVDAEGNTITSFNNDKTLTFSGLAQAGDGTYPTVTDKTGSPVSVGTSTSEAITFVNGVSSSASGAAKLLAYKAETATLNVTDSDTLSSTSPGGAGVSLTIANVAPVGGTHYLTTAFNSFLNVSATTLAGLSYDANHDVLTITAVDSPSANGGTVSLDAGTITYTPATDFAGTDTFTYTVSDGALTGTGTASVTVRPYGSVTSKIAYISPPDNGTVHLRAYGIPGKDYDVQRSTDPEFPFGSTVVLDTVTAASNGVILYDDTNPPGGQADYRLAVH